MNPNHCVLPLAEHDHAHKVELWIDFWLHHVSLSRSKPGGTCRPPLWNLYYYIETNATNIHTTFARIVKEMTNVWGTLSFSFIWITTEYLSWYIINILPLILTIYPSVLHDHAVVWIGAIFHRSHSLFLHFVSSTFNREKYWLETKRILISVAPPQLSPNTVRPISCRHHQCQPPLTASCRVDCCDAALHPPPQNPQRQAPSGPVWPYFAQHPFSPFLTSAFLFLYVHFNSPPSYLTPPFLTPSPLAPHSSYSQSEASAAALSSLDFGPLCCTMLFLSLWCHTH